MQYKYILSYTTKSNPNATPFRKFKTLRALIQAHRALKTNNHNLLSIHVART